MSVSKGKGLIVPIIFALITFIFNYIVESMTGRSAEEFDEFNLLVMGIASFVSGVVIYLVGKKLNQDKDIMVTNKQTGEHFKLGIQHSFSFMRVEWWGISIMVLGVLSIIAAIAQYYFLT